MGQELNNMQREASRPTWADEEDAWKAGASQMKTEDLMQIRSFFLSCGRTVREAESRGLGWSLPPSPTAPPALGRTSGELTGLLFDARSHAGGPPSFGIRGRIDVGKRIEEIIHDNGIWTSL